MLTNDNLVECVAENEDLLRRAIAEGVNVPMYLMLYYEMPDNQPFGRAVLVFDRHGDGSKQELMVALGRSAVQSAAKLEGEDKPLSLLPAAVCLVSEIWYATPSPEEVDLLRRGEGLDASISERKDRREAFLVAVLSDDERNAWGMFPFDRVDDKMVIIQDDIHRGASDGDSEKIADNLLAYFYKGARQEFWSI